MEWAPLNVPTGGEAGKFCLHFLRGFMVAFRIKATDGVDDGDIRRMDAHEDDFEQGHHFGFL